jgi:hypothetical protein
MERLLNRRVSKYYQQAARVVRLARKAVLS